MNKKIIPIIGILLVLGVGGYMFLQQKSGPPVSPEMRKAQQEMMANCKYDQDFCKYASSGLVAMSGGYTMTSESTYGGKKTKMIMKSDGKENSESTTFNEGKEEGSFISLNKVTYMKGPGETVWTEFPVTKDEAGKKVTNLFDFEGLKKELGDIKSNEKAIEETLVVKKVGSEKCGQYTCSIFEMTDKTESGVSTKIWVDTTQYFARKMETSTKEGTSTISFEYGPVVISKPSPVKKMPSFDTGTTNPGAGIDMEEVQRLMKDLPQTNTGDSAPPAEETPIE